MRSPITQRRRHKVLRTISSLIALPGALVACSHAGGSGDGIGAAASGAPHPRTGYASVSAEVSHLDHAGRRLGTQAHRGSAVAITPCIAVTNAHVVGGATTPAARVRITRADGLVAQARVIGTGTHNDIAVLGLPIGFLEPATVRYGTPSRGEVVIATGTASDGRPASITGRVVNERWHDPRFGSGFKATIPAAPGYSGGPVRDTNGFLVGVFVAISREDAPSPRAGFALNMDAVLADVRRVLASTSTTDPEAAQDTAGCSQSWPNPAITQVAAPTRR